MRRVYFLIVIAFVLLLQACYRPSPKESMLDLQALTGSWSSQQVQFFEIWEVTSDTLMEGLGYSMKGADTVFQETLKIFCKEESVFLAVKQGDESNYTLFNLIEAGRSRWVFENKMNEYPNIIIYDLSENELVASIMNSKGHKKIEFKMKRQ
jgi:hypothetical protein